MIAWIVVYAKFKRKSDQHYNDLVGHMVKYDNILGSMNYNTESVYKYISDFTDIQDMRLKKIHKDLDNINTNLHNLDCSLKTIADNIKDRKTNTVNPDLTALSTRDSSSNENIGEISTTATSSGV
jgi:hypothetical protein